MISAYDYEQETVAKIINRVIDKYPTIKKQIAPVKETDFHITGDTIFWHSDKHNKFNHFIASIKNRKNENGTFYHFIDSKHAKNFSLTIIQSCNLHHLIIITNPNSVPGLFIFQSDPRSGKNRLRNPPPCLPPSTGSSGCER